MIDLNFKKGSVLYLLLMGDKEMMGVWSDRSLYPDGFIVLENAAHIIPVIEESYLKFETTSKKGLTKVSEDDDFYPDLVIKISNILFIKQVNEQGKLYKEFINLIEGKEKINAES